MKNNDKEMDELGQKYWGWIMKNGVTTINLRGGEKEILGKLGQNWSDLGGKLDNLVEILELKRAGS